MSDEADIWILFKWKNKVKFFSICAKSGAFDGFWFISQKILQKNVKI